MFKLLSIASLTASLVVLTGCDDDSSSEPALPEGCNFFVEADGGQEELITAFVDVEPGETVCLGEGTWTMTKQATLTANDITVKGEGGDKTVLDFSGQISGGNGILIEGDNNVIQSLKVINTPGDGIRANDVDGITFDSVHVGWDAAESLDNGAYALYPVQSSNVTIVNSVVWGARDAGVYLGQSTNSLLEGNEAYGNVIGIEVENSWDTVVRNNHAHDNTNGILVITLPQLDQLDGKRANVYDNVVENNNVENFGDQGTTVGILPKGIGILMVATDSNEIWNNTVTGNVSTGIALVSYVPPVFTDPGDPNFDLYSENNYIHDNALTGNGADPDVTFLALIGGLTPAPEVIHDGCFNEMTGSNGNCIVPGNASFTSLDSCIQSGGASEDLGPWACTQPPLPTESPVDGGWGG